MQVTFPRKYKATGKEETEIRDFDLVKQEFIVWLAQKGLMETDVEIISKELVYSSYNSDYLKFFKGPNLDLQPYWKISFRTHYTDNELENILFPEDIFYEDNAVSNTWMTRSKHFEYIQEPLYFYYQHDSSTVHSISKKNLEDRMAAGRMIVSEAKENGYYEDYLPEIEFQYTVLFYVNTLFSAMPKKYKIKGCYNFCKALGKEMKETFPDFQNNRYYLEKIHPEERKLIGFQMKSHLFFYIYYRLLWFYRDLRSGLSGRN